MIPSRTQYPDFVPDQLLTSESLNDLFGYLDEQGRATRTNLLGIGIACGLEVRTAASGTSIEITKGTGVTSEGHLVAFGGDLAERTFGYRADFDPRKEAYYDKFLRADHSAKFDLWELKRAAAGSDEVPLTKAFLEGDGVASRRKVVLVFVELLEEQNKNCNPESCDDKGVTVHVNLRFLLAEKGALEAAGLKPAAGPYFANRDWATLPALRMRRFDVTATPIQSAAGLLTAYRGVLTSSFLAEVEHDLSLVWASFKDLLGGEFRATNPFATLAERFAYVHDGTIDASRLRWLQYVYDHVSDLVAAYDELRRTGMEVLGKCCPDATLFPRHLMLDVAIPADPLAPTEFRHRFQRSPLFEERDLLPRLRSLFRRAALLAGGFHVPEPPVAPANPDDTIRITPSRLDASPLSEKAIPFYYRPDQPAGHPLYEEWSFEKTQQLAARTNLSWHAGLWATQDFATHPLRYDLEPYDFLRVEGHLGKNFAQAIGDLKTKVKTNRLPVDVVGVVLGSDASGTEIADVRSLRAFQMQYELLRAEVVCCLRNQAKYWGSLKVREDLGYGKVESIREIAPERTWAVRMAVSTPDKAVGDEATPAVPVAPAPASAAAGASPSPRSGEGVYTIAAGLSPKVEAVIAGAQEILQTSIYAEYLGYQAAGDLDMSLVPAPAGALDAAVVGNYALKFLDAVASLLVVLDVDDPLALDGDALARKVAGLEADIAALLKLVEAELAVQRPFKKVRAYVGESQARTIDAIERAMPDLTEAEADILVLLLLNLPTTEIAALVRQLQTSKGNRSAQAAALRDRYATLDRDGMMVPVAKDIPSTGDPFLVALREKLRDFGCLCALAGFAKLQKLLRDHLADLRRANLFSVFAQDHPGLQHKGGVPMGGTFVVAYLRKGGTTTDAADARYRTVADGFPDGMVVADFYLPYRIASNLPPVVFQVTESEPPPEVVTLSLQPNPLVAALRYSVGDATAYAFAVSPGLGSLTNGTSANGVTTQGADHFVFTPSQTRALVGNDLKAEIEFTYVKRGVASAPVKVAVFNLPTAEISLASTAAGASSAPPGGSVAVKASSKFADAFRWVLQDAAGRTEDVGTALDLGSVAPKQVGDYTLVLVATQSATGAKIVSNTLRISVKPDPEKPGRTCGSLEDIVGRWKAAKEKTDLETYASLEKAVLEPAKMDDYFEKLAKVASQGVNAQIEFFAGKVVQDQVFAESLDAWTSKLRDLLRREKPGPRRLLMLEIYRILVALLLYVSCLRKTDLARVDAQLFSDLVAQLKGKGGADPGIRKIKELSSAEKEVLEGLRKDVADEVERNKANQKSFPKPSYATALAALLAAV